MASRLGRLAVIAAAVTTLGAGVAFASPASADPDPAGPSDNVTVVGTGTIMPGLPATGCTAGQHVTFNGTAAVAGDEAGVYAISFDGGSDICESLANGHGSGTVTASAIAPANPKIACNVTYTRVGNVVTLTGSCTGGHTLGVNAFQFAPTTANPTTSYGLTGSATLND